MNKRTKEIIILTSLVLIVGFVACIGILNKYSNSEIPDTELTYSKCCDGHFCSDTYYSELRNKCVLSLCEGSMFQFNKSKCEYEPN